MFDKLRYFLIKGSLKRYIDEEQNPKVIQALLGHKSVKTTITTYNSVDKSYFQKATDVINKNFKVEESKTSPKDMEDDELEKLLREKQARRKRNKDFEM